MECAHVVKRFELLHADRKSNLDHQWDAITRLVRPSGPRPYMDQTGEASIEWQVARTIYDGTAPVSAVLLSSGMHGAITSGEWFDLRYRETELRKVKEAKEWIESAAYRIMQELNEASFPDEMAKLYYDLVTYGTGAMMAEQVNPKPGEWDGLTYTALPIKEIYFEVGHDDKPYQFFRHMKWPLSKVVDKWGLDELDANTVEAYHANPNERIEIIFCIYRRESVDREVIGHVEPSKMPYGYKYVCRKDAKQLGDEGGYYRMPVYIARWRLMAESMWGWSPAMDAMGDVATANELTRLDLRAREIALDPPRKVQERALVGKLNAGPRGMTTMRDINGEAPLNTAIHYRATDAGLASLRDRIREYFYVPQLQLKESPAMTATEANMLYEQMQKFMSVPLGRIKADVLDPVVQDAFTIMYLQDQLEPLPEQLPQGTEWDVVYHGQVARSLARDRANNIQQFASVVAGLAEVMPELVHAIDPMDFVRVLAHEMDVPEDILRGDEEILQIIEAQQEAARMAQAAALEAAQGEAMQSIGQGAQALQGAA